MAQLITREELALVLDETISTERFDALYKQGLRVVRSGYRGDPEQALPHAQEVVAGVLFGVMVRMASNPRGQRQLNAGGAGLTFGGTDDTIAKVFTLTQDELDALADVDPTRATRPGAAFSIRPGS